MVVVGQVIGGEFSKVIVRQKHGYSLSLGQLVVADCNSHKVLLQVYDLVYGSQISQQNLELISGLDMEQNSGLDVNDAHLRNYSLAFLKSLLIIEKSSGKICKELPDFLSKIREVEKEDLSFITSPKDPLFVGNLRSGNKVIDTEINLPGMSVLSEHVLIPASTGKGKSNLVKTVLWSLADKDFCGILVLDPHDEYFGRNNKGLKDHPSRNIKYYSPSNVPSGYSTLKISLSSLRPSHFNGVINFSDPQWMSLHSYYRKFGKDWISAIVLERKLDFDFAEGTLNVVRRSLMSLLSLRIVSNDIKSNGVFDINSGESTISDIVSDLENSKTVIIDTSSLAGQLEILVGSLITSEILRRYKFYKLEGLLQEKPVISIVLEEAPRVIGKEVLEKGSNIFSTVAREGRKFKIGLIAITQLPSLIPRPILANMNTKIILGTEMAPERQAIIDSSAQDLSDDNRNIASLDKGEAIITSNFARFATPIKVPLFEDIVNDLKRDKIKPSFSGIKLS